MTGAFGWHLPIWWGTSLPDIGWLAFHSPYSFYYSRNDSGSSDAQKMHEKRRSLSAPPQRKFLLLFFCLFSFPAHGRDATTDMDIKDKALAFSFPAHGRDATWALAAEGQDRVFISRSRARCNRGRSLLFSFPAHGRDATVPYPLQAVLCFDTPVCANRLLLLFGTVFFSCSEMMLDACSRTEPANIFSLSL